MNKEVEYVNRCRRKKREWVQAIKEATPCVDCGRFYPYYVMDFDHVRGEKKFTIADACSTGIGRKRILKEMAKCDIVCANCHRIREYQTEC